MRNIRFMSVRTTIERMAGCLLLLGAWASAVAEPMTARKPDLYYLVVDMSGSIPMYQLTQAVEEEVTAFVRALPDHAVLKIQLFNDRVSPDLKREIGPNVTAKAKQEIIDWFLKTYKPSGDTLLYDATGKALEEITRERDRYNGVRLLVVSDGVDDPRGRPTKFPSWSSLLPLTGALTRGELPGDAIWLYFEAIQPHPNLPQPGGEKVPRPPEPIKTMIVGRDASKGALLRAVPPDFDFDVHPAEVSAGASVQFFPTREIGVTALEWTFSTGQTSTERNPRITFNSPAVIDVKVCVQGPGGEVVLEKPGIVRVLEVAPPPAPRGEFTAHPALVSTGQEVLFTVRSNIGIDSYQWDFGDGNRSSEPQPRHSYDKLGTYSVTLSVTGPGGTDRVTKEAAVEVGTKMVAAKFSASPSSGEAPLTVNFRNESEGEYASLRWEFGDGTRSEDMNPTHTYSEVGKFTPRLVVTNLNGQESRSDEKLVIHVREPMPAWQKAVIAGFLCLLAWVALVVPILRRFIGLGVPSLGRPLLKTTRTHDLSALARRARSNIFWPRNNASIGHTSKADIRLPGSGSPVVAKVQRVAFKKALRLVSCERGGAARVERRRRPDGQIETNTTPISRSSMLKDGDELNIGGTDFVFQWNLGKKPR